MKGLNHHEIVFQLKDRKDMCGSFVFSLKQKHRYQANVVHRMTYRCTFTCTTAGHFSCTGRMVVQACLAGRHTLPSPGAATNLSSCKDLKICATDKGTLQPVQKTPDLLYEAVIALQGCVLPQLLYPSIRDWNGLHCSQCRGWTLARKVWPVLLYQQRNNIISGQCRLEMSGHTCTQIVMSTRTATTFCTGRHCKLVMC